MHLGDNSFAKAPRKSYETASGKMMLFLAVSVEGMRARLADRDAEEKTAPTSYKGIAIRLRLTFR
jgi:hypothetical protein